MEILILITFGFEWGVSISINSMKWESLFRLIIENREKEKTDQ